MNDKKYTPGPWECDPIGHEVYETHRDTVICTLPLVRTIYDARIIAVSPEMFELIEEFIERCEKAGIKDWNNTVLAKAKAIIQKVKG